MSAPIPTTRPFAETAFDLTKRGLAVIPCPGNDGKSPRGAVAGYDRWEKPPGPDAIRRFAADHGDANIGIITSLSRLTVADVDDGGRDADEIIRRAGDTPMITRTPSAGLHLWYRSSGERSSNLRPSWTGVPFLAGPGHQIGPCAAYTVDLAAFGGGLLKRRIPCHAGEQRGHPHRR